MKTWVYRVIFKRGKKQLPDGRIFRELAQADIYAQSSCLNYSIPGLKYDIETLEFVKPEAKHV